MRIYLSGPMRGIPDYNFSSFDNACRVLRGAKDQWGGIAHVVLAPHEHDREIGYNPSLGVDPTPEELAMMMKWDLEQVLLADAIVLLPGWQRSVGALSELLVAVRTGRALYEFDPSAKDGMRAIPTPAMVVSLVPIMPKVECTPGCDVEGYPAVSR